MEFLRINGETIWAIPRIRSVKEDRPFFKGRSFH